MHKYDKKTLIRIYNPKKIGDTLQRCVKLLGHFKENPAYINIEQCWLCNFAARRHSRKNIRVSRMPGKTKISIKHIREIHCAQRPLTISAKKKVQERPIHHEGRAQQNEQYAKFRDDPA